MKQSWTTHVSSTKKNYCFTALYRNIFVTFCPSQVVPCPTQVANDDWMQSLPTLHVEVGNGDGQGNVVSWVWVWQQLVFWNYVKNIMGFVLRCRPQAGSQGQVLQKKIWRCCHLPPASETNWQIKFRMISKFIISTFPWLLKKSVAQYAIWYGSNCFPCFFWSSWKYDNGSVCNIPTACM